MEIQRGKTNYSSKPMPRNDDKMKGDLQEIWTKFSKKGPRFDERDFDYFFSGIKNKGNNDEYIKQLKETFLSELNHVKKYAKKYSRKILDNIGKSNLTDSQVWEYVNKQAKKHNFSRPITDAIYREVAHRLLELPNRSSFFRFNPSMTTKLSTTLGFSGVENFSVVRVTKEEQEVLDDIMVLDEQNKLTYIQIVDQALQYQDCDPNAVVGIFNPERHNRYQHVHPVIAALFIPKIPIIDEVMLFASISNIVKARVNNEPIIKRPEYDLLYNMAHDKNEFVCDNRNVWKDLKYRAEIQVALWRAVLNLRSGRYYDEAGAILLGALDRCRFYRYEAFDIIHSGDEGDIIRRLLSVFSFKPIYVQTLPIVQQNYLTMVTPFTNLDLYNGEMDVLPIVNLRLNTMDTSDVYLSNVLNTYEVFFDSSNKLLIPKMTKIINTKGVLIIYVHRKNYALQLNKFNGPFTFRDLPVSDRALFSINKTAVFAEELLVVNNTNYNLRSVVCINTIALDEREIISGCEALIKPLINLDISFGPLFSICSIVYLSKLLSGNVLIAFNTCCLVFNGPNLLIKLVIVLFDNLPTPITSPKIGTNASAVDTPAPTLSFCLKY